MKEICKNCENVRPTYKKYECELTGKRVKVQDTCEKWKQKGADHGKIADPR